DIVLSLVVHYVAYLSAERLNLSGVLATVTAGIYAGAQAAEHLSASTRLTGAAFWNMLVFLLNGVVFMVIGLQLPEVIQGLHQHPWGTLLSDAALVGGAVIVTRIVWVFFGARVPRIFVKAGEPSEASRRPPWRNIAVFAWCGMRGVVSLAAALAIPRVLPSGREFPERDLILFFTFAVILLTLVGQGLTLPCFIRRLRVSTG